MITEDKVTEIFCIADDLCNFFDAQRWQNIRLRQKGSANITMKAAWLLFPRNQVPVKWDRIF